MSIDDDLCVLSFCGRWITVSIAVEQAQDFMKSLLPVMISKHLSVHIRAIMVSKIFGKLHFRMPLVIGPRKSTYKSNHNYSSSIGATLAGRAPIQC
jgi:hypothetical protein